MPASFSTGYAIIVSGAPTPIVLNSVNGLSVDPGTQEIINYGAGVQTASFIGTMTAAPMLSFTTTDIQTAMNAFQLSGLSFPQAPLYTTVDAYFTKIGVLSPRVANLTAEHIRFRMGDTGQSGLIVPKTLSWAQGGEATLSLEIHPISTNGITFPWTVTNSIALPATVPLISEKFTGGKVIINAAANEVFGVQGVSIDFGIEVEKLYESGTIFPTRVHILRVNPMITIKTKDAAANIAAFDLDGTAMGPAINTDVYFRSIGSGGGARTVGNDYRIRMTKGMIWSGAAGGGNNDSFESEIRIKPIVTAVASDVMSFTSGTTQP